MEKARLFAIFVVAVSCMLPLEIQGRGVAGNIKLVMMRNNQYWFSTTSPFSPTLNFFLAYEYCRNLGLQLATLETREEVDTIAAYLSTSEASSGNQPREYWTSGNKLGAESWLWMSNGEQMNSSFVAENALQQRQNIHGAPVRNCLTMRAMNTRRAVFNPELCERSLPFICEQIRCLSYYYPTVEYPEAQQPGSTDPEFASPTGQRSEVVVANETVSASA